MTRDQLKRSIQDRRNAIAQAQEKLAQPGSDVAFITKHIERLQVRIDELQTELDVLNGKG